MNADPLDPVYVDPKSPQTDVAGYASTTTLLALIVLVVVPLGGLVYWLKSARGQVLIARMTGRKDKVGGGYGRLPL